MNCEELVISVVVVTMMLILMACICTRSFETDGDENYPVRYGCDTENFTSRKIIKKGRPSNPTNPNIIWGGVPIDYRSTMNHAYPSQDEGYLPVTNSMTAIRRLQAEEITPPWSNPESDIKESFDSKKGGQFIDMFMAKRGTVAKTFRPGFTKNNTALRHLNV